MKKTVSEFQEEKLIHDLKHYLPSQAPLKDFIHHNTLHAFQEYSFPDALNRARTIFGYNTSLSIKEYRELFETGKIREDILDQKIKDHQGEINFEEWKDKVLTGKISEQGTPRTGLLRSTWKTALQIDISRFVHPLLFRLIGSYLDQGISIWKFPFVHRGFLSSLKELERNAFTSIFKTKRARFFLQQGQNKLEPLLALLIGDSSLYEHYVFDQQFEHEGWSGMAALLEDNPHGLLEHKKISLHELIFIELLLEIDYLDSVFGEKWKPLSHYIQERPKPLFDEVPENEHSQIIRIWQEAFEWTFYNQVLNGIVIPHETSKKSESKSFQALFCIDDRECSLRRYVENADDACETFGTPGFFGVEFYFQPDKGKFFTKLCPAPVTPKFLIKETGIKNNLKKDAHFAQHSHSLFGGWLITQTLGFWSALRLFLNVFRPSVSPASASSFRHMDKQGNLSVEFHGKYSEDGLQIGFKTDEMASRLEALLKSIGLVKDFAPIVYLIGHGSSSVNNPHYSAYDCGACSGRPGSVNARVMAYMANHPEARNILSSKGINIPAETIFIGGLHDTTRDEIEFFDTENLKAELSLLHKQHVKVFDYSLKLNARERSRRLETTQTTGPIEKVHERMKRRSVSLFEPRPELNHATNALCIVGRRELSKHLFLDRRSFLNSFDYTVDPEGNYLFNILNAVAPVCGGINLEYYFSRVDNARLGAGTKLPHNVMGLFGVANGIDGDLRTGLPSQMIEVHDPVRLMVIVEHFPEIILNTIQRSEATYQWFINQWIHLIAVHPETKKLFRFINGAFESLSLLPDEVPLQEDIESLLEASDDNIHVFQLSESK